jgi:hypothetical protein
LEWLSVVSEDSTLLNTADTGARAKYLRAAVLAHSIHVLSPHATSSDYRSTCRRLQLRLRCEIVRRAAVAMDVGNGKKSCWEVHGESAKPDQADFISVLVENAAENVAFGSGLRHPFHRKPTRRLAALTFLHPLGARQNTPRAHFRNPFSPTIPQRGLFGLHELCPQNRFLSISPAHRGSRDIEDSVSNWPLPSPSPSPQSTSASEEASRKQDGRQDLQFKHREPSSKDRARQS